MLRSNTRHLTSVCILGFVLFCFCTPNTCQFPRQVSAQIDVLRNERRSKYTRERDFGREGREERKQQHQQNREQSHGGWDDEEINREEINSIVIKLFRRRGPRDIIEGLKKGVIGLVLGTFSGIFCLVVPTYAFSSHGIPGILGGLAVGFLSAAISMFSGALFCLTNVVIGLSKTPRAIYSSWFQGKTWDDANDEWIHYSLEEEIEELLNVESTRRSVYDSTFYDILGVKSSSSSKEIKRAYYSKAKDVHPDKNPDDEDAAAQFVQLHKAYQTLSDQKSREAYDSWGKSSSTATDGLDNFNVDVFFEVLFGSQQVELYVGQLAVATAFGRILKLAREVDLEVILKFLADAEIQNRKRPVQVASHIRERIEKFVDGNMSLDDYKKSCDDEAEAIASTGFGEAFLLYIGKILTQESSIFLHKSLFRWPLWIYSSSTKKSRQWQQNFSDLKLLQDFYKSVASKDGTEPNGEDIITEDSFNISGDDIENLLPKLLDLAWAYNARDISNLLEEVCSKLLYDTGGGSSRSVRVQRAKALRILGQSFLDRSRRDENNMKDTSSCEDLDMEKQNIKARLQVAFQTASLGTSAPSTEESEEMILEKAKNFVQLF